MRKFFLSLFSFILIMSITTQKASANKPFIKEIRIVETSDVHGAFFPYNFIERQPMSGSMARVSSFLKAQRRMYGNLVVAIDNGDILQGQPVCYYSNVINTDAPNVAAEVVNYMNYDAQVFGNHDIETGHEVYDKWIKDLHCPVLGANVINTSTGKPYTLPYIIIDRDGLKIAILGLVTPAIPHWLSKNLWEGMRFEEMIASARHWMKVLRTDEHADIIIGVFHSGWDGGIMTEEYEENATKKIAERVSGFDAIFFGHDHAERAETINGVPCLNPSCNANKVAVATITLIADPPRLTPDGRVPSPTKGLKWRIADRSGEIVDISDLPVDEDYMKHFQPTIDSVNAYVNREIGVCPVSLHTRDCFFGPAAFTDYIHGLQLEQTGADVSFNAPLNFDSEIKQGPVFMSDMFKLYRFENQIYVLRMTGEEIRKYLEYSYDLWINTMQSPDDHIMLLTGQTLNDQRIRFKNLTFNFDSAAGIAYEVDVTKPNGQRIRILRFSDGRPFDGKAWYHVAMNSYRGNGGGELLTNGAGIPVKDIPNRIVSMSQYDQRYYLTQKIEKEGSINTRPYTNWCFVPEEWTKPALQRDRKLLFKE